jgi:hypothetical protein
MYGSSPARSVQRPPRGTPEMLTGYPSGPAPPSVICHPTENPDMEMYHSRGVGTGMDDESSSVAEGNSSSKDKGRGSYKCGRVSYHLGHSQHHSFSHVETLTLVFTSEIVVWSSQEGSRMSVSTEVNTSTWRATP